MQEEDGDRIRGRQAAVDGVGGRNIARPFAHRKIVHII